MVVVDSVVGSLDETVDVVLASTYNIQKSICYKYDKGHRIYRDPLKKHIRFRIKEGIH